jgi:hypothetical protein
MEHLGIEAAFFATQVPGDVVDLAWGRPGRIKGLVLCVPMLLDARPFERVARRLLMISGDAGISDQTTLSAQGTSRQRSDIYSRGTSPRAGPTSSPTERRRWRPQSFGS